MSEETFEKLYYGIGEVTTMLNITPSMLRFWEKEFPELKPHKNKKGNRLYTASDIETIKLIYFLTKEKGYTLAGAREIISNQRQRTEKNMAIMDSLKKLRQFLVEVKEGL
jgi:DNA-binding transcriptional MerR regulator